MCHFKGITCDTEHVMCVEFECISSILSKVTGTGIIDEVIFTVEVWLEILGHFYILIYMFVFLIR